MKTNPTPGAIRASGNVYASLSKALDRIGGPDRQKVDEAIARDWMARVIDKQTRLPELIAALEKIKANSAENPEWIHRVASEALAKATE